MTDNETPPEKSTFVDPYDHLDEAHKTRLQTFVSNDDHLFIKSIRPQKKTVLITNNILWHKLTEALKSHGITSYTDVAKFEQFVTDLQITLPDGHKLSGRTARRTSGKAVK
jgi:hypothetical protein